MCFMIIISLLSLFVDLFFFLITFKSFCMCRGRLWNCFHNFNIWIGIFSRVKLLGLHLILLIFILIMIIILILIIILLLS